MLKPEGRLAAGTGMVFAFWILASTAVGLWQRIAPRGHGGVRLNLLSRAFLGQCIAHTGFALSIIGIVLTSYETVDLHTRMAPGETKNVGPYAFQFVKLREYKGPNYDATEGTFRITKDGAFVAELTPEKRNYTVRAMPMTEAGIAPGLTRDLYISMGEPLGDGAWSVRLHYKAFVRFIWLGALVMAIGGLTAIGDRRFRLATRTSDERHTAKA
jgi:cytochrome c-type biogenesis protein CcmF